VQKIFDFEQGKGEILPKSWTRFCSLIRALPKEPLPKNELLDIFYNGLTDESKTYLDSCASYVFRERTPAEAEKLMAKISQNHDDWTLVEPTPTPAPATVNGWTPTNFLWRRCTRFHLPRTLRFSFLQFHRVFFFFCYCFWFSFSP
jgi:hypothetical protein